MTDLSEMFSAHGEGYVVPPPKPEPTAEDESCLQS